MMGTEMEMPKYKCHKEVHALKLKEIHHGVSELGKCTFIPEDEGYAPFEVNSDWCHRKAPKPYLKNTDSGYYVVYEDGYRSWSPTKAFEDGYTRL
jgi:hypothetical protein